MIKTLYIVPLCTITKVKMLIRRSIFYTKEDKIIVSIDSLRFSIIELKI